MNKKIQLRTINFKIFIISIVVLIFSLTLVMNISSRFNYDRIYFIIFSLIVIVGSLIALEQKSTKFFNLIFKENQLLIDGKENNFFFIFRYFKF